MFGWRAWGLASLGLAQASVLLLGSGANNADQLTSVLFAAGLGASALIWLAYEPQFSKVPIAWVLALALVLRLIAAQAVPLLEDDHYRYLWDGFRSAAAFDPYLKAPAEFFTDRTLAAPWPSILNGINNPHLPTIYGPVLQLVFWLGYLISPGDLWGIKALLLVIDLTCLGLLARAKVDPRWLLAYALHPVVLKEVMASAHPDGIVGFILFCACLAWQSQRWLTLGLLLGTAIATKISALVVLPLLVWLVLNNKSARLRLALGIGISLVIWYGPFVINGQSDFKSLAVFAQSWRFNPLLFRLFDFISDASIARALAGLCIAAIVAFLAWSEKEKTPRWDLAIVALLSFAPVVNPWYWLWALAPAVLLGRIAVPVMAIIASLAYINSAVLSGAASFYVAWPITLIQIFALLALLTLDIRASKFPTF